MELTSRQQDTVQVIQTALKKMDDKYAAANAVVATAVKGAAASAVTKALDTLTIANPEKLLT
ncbi:Variable outer membrane protein (plasmid) [Borrelia hermsii YBT]|uniref:Variable large protein n=1 Tax=Borrelia hermsii YBT TaxID=1313295 RepID=W5T2J6_BORHE|nr:Variable outer membrane protein [Borrelia hermsii YBT]